MLDNSNFIHLHLHTEYSILDGLGKPEQYILKAKELGFNAIAITDHGSVDGAVKWQKVCKEYNIKPIFGCEFYIVPNYDTKKKGEKRGHILVLAKNRNGFNSILKMLNLANMYGFYYRPRIDYGSFLKYAEDVVVSTACPSSFLTLKNGITFFENLLDKFGNDLYLEMMPSFFELLHIEYIKKLFDMLFKFKKEYSLDMIATNDCHYVNKNDSVAQEVLLAIQNKAKWNDKNRFRFTVTELYLKTADEMFNTFKDLGWNYDKEIITAINNTSKVAEKLDCNLSKAFVTLPLVKTIVCDDEDKFFLNLVKQKFNEKRDKFVCDEKIYRKRMRHEFLVLKKLGFIRYFLIVWELKKWCDKNNILTGPGRGSVSGSLISWLLDITMLDPIKYGLLFERFIDENRVDLPDVDIDVEDRFRNKVIDHLKDLYGEFNVAGISTFLRMKSKMVLKDVSRVFDVDFYEVNNVTKLITNSLEDVIKNTSEGRRFARNYKQITDLALILEGQIRTAGRHAAGIVINNKPFDVSDKTYLVTRAKNRVCNWDKYDAEYMGMLKLDVLGLSTLSIFHYAFDLIKKNHNKIITFNDIDLDDEVVYKEFAKGNCVGIFQFSTYGLTKLAKDLKIDNFDLLSTATALYRPAPLQSGLVDRFKQCRNDYKQIKYFNKRLRKVLKDTLGIIVYQEQIMLSISVLSGFNLYDSDKLRKALDKNNIEEINKLKEKFINGCVENGILIDKAKELWFEIKKWGGYAFNKSHAYAYSMLSYFGMWLKVYFPLEYLCASLCFCASGREEELISEALRLGLKVYFPKVKFSDAILWTENGEDTIFMPFVAIKGIGEKTAIKIKNGIKGGFFKPTVNSKIDKLLTAMCSLSDDMPTTNNIVNYLSFPISKYVIRKLKLMF